MRVLGLDPGSRRTGWGVVERRGRQCVLLAAGEAASDPDDAMPARLHAIVRAVREVIATWAPDCVVIEQAFHHRNVRSTLVLGHVRGALMLAAAEAAIPVAEYSPREIKLAVTGHGGAAKEQVSAMVSRLLGSQVPLGADAADALAGALCHVQRQRFSMAERAPSPAARRLEALLAGRSPR